MKIWLRFMCFTQIHTHTTNKAYKPIDKIEITILRNLFAPFHTNTFTQIPITTTKKKQNRTQKNAIIFTTDNAIVMKFQFVLCPMVHHRIPHSAASKSPLNDIKFIKMRLKKFHTNTNRWRENEKNELIIIAAAIKKRASPIKVVLGKQQQKMKIEIHGIYESSNNNVIRITTTQKESERNKIKWHEQRTSKYASCTDDINQCFKRIEKCTVHGFVFILLYSTLFFSLSLDFNNFVLFSTCTILFAIEL